MIEWPAERISNMKLRLIEYWRTGWKVSGVTRDFACFIIVFFVVGIYGALEPVNNEGSIQEPRFSNTNPATIPTNTLLTNLTARSPVNRIGAEACSKDNILVDQGATEPLPDGIPTYTVEIQNVCVSGNCSISDIHLSCGWFSSARLVDPSIFRRIDYDDCLVNNGDTLNPGEVVSFQYANTFKYTLSVSSVAC